MSSRDIKGDKMNNYFCPHCGSDRVYVDRYQVKTYFFNGIDEHDENKLGELAFEGVDFPENDVVGCFECEKTFEATEVICKE